MIVSSTSRLATAIMILVAKGMAVSLLQHAFLRQGDEDRKEHLVNVIERLRAAVHGLAAPSRADRHRHLFDAKACEVEADQGVGVGIIMRIVVVNEEAHQAAMNGLKAARWVGDLLAREPRSQLAKEPDAESAAQRNLVICLTEKARAERQVGCARKHRFEQLREVLRVVLAVAVNQHADLITVLDRVE